MNVTYLTSYIDVGRGATITTATTIITILLARAILTPAIIMARSFVIARTTIIIAGAVVAVLLAWAVLAPTIVIARPLVIAWTAVFIAVALLLALIMARTTIIITRTSVTASHIC
jgi:hypothetical protein